MLVALTDSNMDDALISAVAINMIDPEDHAAIDELVSQLAQIVPQNDIFVRYEKTADDDDSADKNELLVNQLFNGLVCIVMFLSFFSLSASMSSNINNQKKEVGVLRAMGLTKCRIRLLYFYEALILVVSSSVLGTLIGCSVGYTMQLQFNLLTKSSVPVTFPW